MAEFSLDTSTPFGERVARRLNDEIVVWLVTVRADGTPEPSPVWFLWADGSFLIYSLRDTPRERNIRRSQKVGLHFNDASGGDVVVFTGTAEIDEAAPPVHANAPYVAKYAARIERMGSTPAQFGMRYSLPIRVRPDKLRGH